MSVGSGGEQGNAYSGLRGASISADGRYVAFASNASTLVPGDMNGTWHVFVRDRQSGTTERASVDSGGAVGDWDSGYDGVSISADGRYVVFTSDASNLVVGGDTNGFVNGDVYVRDRQSGTTERVSVDSGGVQGNDDSGYDALSISADGRYAGFVSSATNLVAGDTNAREDVFVRDRVSGTTVRVSVDSGGAQGDGYCSGHALSMSPDGRYVAFASNAPNLVVGGDTNGWLIGDAFVRDRQSGITELVSVDSGGAQGNDGSGYYGVSISADGRYAAFTSYATNLVAGDTNGALDVFVRDRQSGTTERVSVDSGGTQGNYDSGDYEVSISADGRYVAFESLASNLVPGDTNNDYDVFVRDRQSGTTERASLASGGAQGNNDSGWWGASVSAAGRYVAFASIATNLVPGDTNGFVDVFVRDREYSPLTSLCDPGSGGVIVCPCSNPAGGPGRGCDNSSGTGGAILSASGVAYLSQDSLVFTTSGEKPTALSIVSQWTGTHPTGAVFGQGVGCTGGTRKKLYSKTASGGSITAPDFGAGDLPVSVRSAALGDTIPAGQTRWYLVYYRDPIVLGGCPASSTFNATQTGAVAWLP
jgi:Tol biopolymer transport system component